MNNALGSCSLGSSGRKIHQRDVFRIFLLEDAEYSKKHELPLVRAVAAENAHPNGLVPFSIAMSRGNVDYDCFVHFYEDDFRFERVWNNPKRYLPELSKYAGVIMPDFSTSIDFPRPLKLWSAYKNQALAFWFQKNGLTVIPNARHEPQCDFLVEALPRKSVIAISGRACTMRVVERRCFMRDVKETVDRLEPIAIVYYGSDRFGVMDYPRSLGIPVWIYPGNARGDLKGGRSGQLP